MSQIYEKLLCQGTLGKHTRHIEHIVVDIFSYKTMCSMCLCVSKKRQTMRSESHTKNDVQNTTPPFSLENGGFFLLRGSLTHYGHQFCTHFLLKFDFNQIQTTR